MKRVKEITKVTSLASFFVFLSIQVFANAKITRSDEDYTYDHYYTVTASKSHSTELLKFENQTVAFPLPVEKFDRKKHFGTWKDLSDDNTCHNTRARVLIRDSQKQVELGGARGCTVTKGLWKDPYTGTTMNLATEIEVDHFVPLKHAYMTGGHEWTPQKRCLYSNYLGSKFHLMPVSKEANQEKSDKSPAEWVPENQAFVCDYLVSWLKTKVIWALRILPSEVDAIHELVKTHKCDTSRFTMSQEELQVQQDYMRKNANICTP